MTICKSSIGDLFTVSMMPSNSDALFRSIVEYHRSFPIQTTNGIPNWLGIKKISKTITKDKHARQLVKATEALNDLFCNDLEDKARLFSKVFPNIDWREIVEGGSSAELELEALARLHMAICIHALVEQQLYSFY